MAFELGPWDKKAKTEGAHVFSRKLLYGDEHDSAEHLPDGADGATYGAVELHRMHSFWRRNVLNVRGGVEFGFMSATRDIETARYYAASQSSVGMVFEIEQVAPLSLPI